MSKKVMRYAITGFPVGIVIGLFISIVFSYAYGLTEYFPAPPRFIDQFASSLNALVISVVIWALIGGVFSCTSLIFTDTDWSITKMSVVHCIVTYILFLPLSLVARWYPLSLVGIGIFTMYYIFIYLIMWTIFMLKAKQDIKKINRRLNSLAK